MADIRVGDKIYAVKPFTASKVIRATAIIARIMRHWRPLMKELAEFNREYETDYAQRITRDLAEARLARLDKDATEEKASWQRLLEGPLKERDFIELPQSPSMELQIAVMFPQVYEKSQDEVLRLVALSVIPDNELEHFWRTKAIDSALDELAIDLVANASVDELMEVVVAASTEIASIVKGQRARMGKLTSSWSTVFQETEPETRKTEPTVGTVIQKPVETSSLSSTDSPPPTDGTTDEPSSGSPSPTSAVSPA